MSKASSYLNQLTPPKHTAVTHIVALGRDFFRIRLQTGPMSERIDAERSVPFDQLLPNIKQDTYQINNLATAPPQTNPPNPSFHPRCAIAHGSTSPENRAIGT